MPSLTRKNLVKFGLLFLVLFVAMDLFIRFIDERDTALQGAERFLQETPQVHDAVGNIKNVSLNKRIYYGGIPGREGSFREYSFGVRGDKSQALITIRAEKESDQYAYRFLRLEQ